MDAPSTHVVGAPDASSSVIPGQTPMSDGADDHMDQQPSQAFFCSAEDDEDATAIWIEVNRRAQRKNQHPTTTAACRSPPKPVTTATSYSKLPSNRPKPPQLLENDYKMGIRPFNGLALLKISLNTLVSCILHEASLTWREADLKIRIKEAQNMLVVSSLFLAAAKALSKIHQLKIEGSIFQVNVCGISPDHSCKGVIRNFSIGVTTEQIMAIFADPGYEPLTCRRLGESGSC
ncbi:hypothetical protein HPB48_011730 [Haemaphysalis longicornis]|uniref:Uncharacterized protein n=1 Tax=Haemaphysalis longicornis TaxID=44386 RepID=A0A9J6GJV4_HAELO|nr:hypothetical protein HPB48_011730 [Haemaphysalis longicornis]